LLVETEETNAEPQSLNAGTPKYEAEMDLFFAV
jgi:hypothetical protein